MIRETAIAQRNFTKAIKLYKRHGKAYYYRGLTWYYLEDYHSAIEDYDKAIAFCPGEGDIYYNRGVANHQSFTQLGIGYFKSN